MSPLGLFMKVWGKWVVVAIAMAGLAFAVDHYRGKADLTAAKLESAVAERKAVEDRETRLIEERKILVENSKAWRATTELIQKLSRDSATARAAEAQQITNIAASVAAAKEGIKHAPGANDRFDFSDAAYGLVRGANEAGAGTGGPGHPSAQAPASVGRR